MNIRQTVAPVRAATTEPQDWESLVTPGHVLGHRLKAVAYKGFPFAVAAFAFGCYLSWGFIRTDFLGYGRTPDAATPRLASWIAEATMADPLSYAKLPDGQRFGFQVAWLADIPRVQGMDEATYRSQIKAVLTDLSQFGRAKDKWTATGQTSAMLTTAPKFPTHYGDLASGVVVFPANPNDLGHPLILTAFVGGQFSAVIVQPNQCVTLAGPKVEGCLSTMPQYAAGQLSGLKP